MKGVTKMTRTIIIDEVLANNNSQTEGILLRQFYRNQFSLSWLPINIQINILNNKIEKFIKIMQIITTGWRNLINDFKKIYK